MVTKLSDNGPRAKTILFLGYNQQQTTLLDQVAQKKINVLHSNDVLQDFGEYDLVVSYGYRHIIDKCILEQFMCPVLNLHISYLPFNRGAHPNFWSFFDNTPKGITIHLVDSGLDTGPIIYQKLVSFPSAGLTFRRAYSILRKELEEMFIRKLDKLLAKDFHAYDQNGNGTYHRTKDLPINFKGWDSEIKQEVSRLRLEGLKYDSK